MGDKNDDQSVLGKLLDILKSLPPLITALVALSAVISGAWIYYFSDINPPTPEISTFVISPDNIVAGDSAILSWNVLNANSILIDHGVGIVKNNTGNLPITPKPNFTSYTLCATNKKNISINKTFPISVQLKNLSLHYSPYEEMTINEEYPFYVSVAMKDSTEVAKKVVAERGIRVKSNAPHNESTTVTTPGSKNDSFTVTNEELTGAILNLTGDNNAFKITLIHPLDTLIFKDDPGHNYVIWHWLVVPQEPGWHTLTIATGLNVDNGKYKRLFDDTYIDIYVNQPVPAITPANVIVPTNETAPAAEEAAAANVTPAKNETPVKTEEKKQPGFEGIFAITGLMAVAYLVGKRKS